MRILGIDPGFRRLGFGVVERNEKEEITLLDFGYFVTERDQAATYNKFLNTAIGFIADKLPGIIHDYYPTYVAAETVPVGRLGANTELVVAAITTCKVVAHQFGLEWTDYGANTVKLTATGDGRATKAQVRRAMCELFPNLAAAQVEVKARQKEKGQRAEGIPWDVFDGCAVAYTGLLKKELEQRED